MSTEKVANRLVELCRAGQNMQAVDELYDESIVSIERDNASNPRVVGKQNVIKKSEQWYAMVDEFHSGVISDPLIAGNHFTVTMNMEVSFKEQGRMQIQEVCVYEVANNKIVREDFFYN